MRTEKDHNQETSAMAPCDHKSDGPCHCTAERWLHNAGIIESDYLFYGRNEIEIRHAGALYRLRLTRNGKLILNK